MTYRAWVGLFPGMNSHMLLEKSLGGEALATERAKSTLV